MTTTAPPGAYELTAPVDDVDLDVVYRALNLAAHFFVGEDVMAHHRKYGTEHSDTPVAYTKLTEQIVAARDRLRDLTDADGVLAGMTDPELSVAADRGAGGPLARRARADLARRRGQS